MKPLAIRCGAAFEIPVEFVPGGGDTSDGVSVPVFPIRWFSAACGHLQFLPEIRPAA
jgi:hypothetical protein